MIRMEKKSHARKSTAIMQAKAESRIIMHPGNSVKPLQIVVAEMATGAVGKSSVTHVEDRIH